MVIFSFIVNTEFRCSTFLYI